MTTIDAARKILQRAVTADLHAVGDTAVCSAIQAVASRGATRALDAALGWAELSPNRPCLPSTPFDVASLTKPLVTATLTMRAVDAGLLTLQTPVGALLPDWAHPQAWRRRVTVLHLLNHSSGLPAWHPFFELYPLNPSPEAAAQNRRSILDDILATPLDAPPGTRHLYSDLGYILLAHLLEHAFGARLDALARNLIFEPLGMRHTRFVARLDGDPALHSAVATEACPRRGRTIVGTVHDQNTDVQGGVAGHAGVFSTARDLARFLAHLLDIFHGRIADGIVSRPTLAFCWSEAARAAHGHHLGGWDTPSGELSSAGRGFHRANTVGHLGFTGTSFWVDLDRDIVAILLTNRVYPSRQNPRIKALRVDFHEAVYAALSRSQPHPP